MSPGRGAGGGGGARSRKPTGLRWTRITSPKAAARDRAAVPFANAEIVPEAQQAALNVLRSGWITMGPQTAEFERELASYLGARHVVAVSCTAAIEIALRALRLPAAPRC